MVCLSVTVDGPSVISDVLCLCSWHICWLEILFCYEGGGKHCTRRYPGPTTSMSRVASDWPWAFPSSSPFWTYRVPTVWGSCLSVLSFCRKLSFPPRKTSNPTRVIFDDGSLRLGIKGEVGVGRERREMSRKGWVAKRYLFLFTWNRPFSILEEGNGIWSPVV